MDPKVQLNVVDSEPLSDLSQYKRLIGRLLYLNLFIPDISFVVHKLSQFLAKHRLPHLKAAHHLLRYLKTNPGQGLFFSSSSIQLKDYLGSCFHTRKFVTSFFIFIGNSLVSWKAKKQNTNS